MKISKIEIKDNLSLKLFSVDELTGLVVFAGPNGVGKTTLNRALINMAQGHHPKDGMTMVLEATTHEEETSWGKKQLYTGDSDDSRIINKHLQSNRNRSSYISSFLNFDSDRAIQNVQQYPFSWDVGDPLTEPVPWSTGLQTMQSRYNEVRHSLFRLVAGQRGKIADQAEAFQAAGVAQMPLNFADVLRPFKDAFWRLLAPKKLVEVNVREQELKYEYDGKLIGVSSLSSGEKEVVNIAFDFILRNPKDSVIMFDEPELHLHPELSLRLIRTLMQVGSSNQFIFLTHSPDIISLALEHSLVFISPAKDPIVNQATVIRQDDATYQALQTLGQSVGVISLGKKVVLIEGQKASLDKQIYSSVTQEGFPEFVLVPTGGKGTIKSFNDIKNNILDKALWGIDFYMLCDRDAVNLLGKNEVNAADKRKVKQLPRYHIENYFLDAEVLADAFATTEGQASPLRQPAYVREELRKIASTCVAYTTALNLASTIRHYVGNVDLMPSGAGAAVGPEELATLIRDRVSEESQRVQGALAPHLIDELVADEYERLAKAVAEDDPIWMADIPGRNILNKFASTVGLSPARIRQLYIHHSTGTHVFDDIISIFNSFRNNT